jgi:hypothetical protein
MYFVPPTAGEQFYLRTLLTIVKGATSFDDLRRYNSNQPLPTFYNACLARSLLEDDGEWNPSQPDQLWEQYRTHICDDLRYHLSTLGINNASTDDIYDYGLHLIDNILHESGHTLSDWPSMPSIRHEWEQYSINKMIAEQLN